MFRLVLLQVIAMFVVGGAAAFIGGFHAAASAVLGALACVLPNALFALRLAMAARRPQGASAGSFFTGEFVKLAVTVALLFAAAWFYPDLNWLAFLAAFIVVMKSYLILLFRH